LLISSAICRSGRKQKQIMEREISALKDNFDCNPRYPRESILKCIVPKLTPIPSGNLFERTTDRQEKRNFLVHLDDFIEDAKESY